MVGLQWATGKKSGSKGLKSELLLVCMGQTSKYVGPLIIPDVAAEDKPVTHPTVGNNNRKFSLNKLGLLLESDQVCDKLLLLNAPIVVRTINFSCYSALQGHKKY